MRLASRLRVMGGRTLLRLFNKKSSLGKAEIKTGESVQCQTGMEIEGPLGGHGAYRSQKVQLELGIRRTPELDRNFEKGGRSFYFFDFDDNIAVLSTPILLFHKKTGEEIRLSSREFGERSGEIGRAGPYQDYEVRFDDVRGSFRYFRDRDMGLMEKLLGRRQIFIQDLSEALGSPEYHWQGPSWNCFYHAVFNRRPVSLITARGHHPETIKSGIRLMVSEGHIPHEPNYLALYPINNPVIRAQLGRSQEISVAEMKQAAIRASVEKAFKMYGHNIHHRFGMSDDDPKNIELIIAEMSRLKREYPHNSFFVFDTHKGQFVRREVFEGHTKDEVMGASFQQLNLFESVRR